MAELTRARAPIPGPAGRTLAGGPLRRSDPTKAGGAHPGAIARHIAAVRLAMEVRGELGRVSDKPVRIGLAGQG